MNYKRFKIEKIIASLLLTIMLGTNVALAAPQLRGMQDDSKQGIKLTGGVSIADKDTMISLSLRNSDVRQVLRMLADKAAMNIIFHNSVEGTVTLDLINVPVNKAFEYIMSVNGLSYWVDGDTIIVAARSYTGSLGFNKQQIKPIKIMYVNAAKVANFLNTNIFSLNNPSVSNSQVAITNPAKNEVLLFGTDKDIQLAQQVIAQLDVEQKISTFKVNHMPAGKMADMICQTVFEEEASGGDSEGDGKGGGTIACKGGSSSTSTSGATSSAGSSSGTASSSTSSSGSSSASAKTADSGSLASIGGIDSATVNAALSSLNGSSPSKQSKPSTTQGASGNSGGVSSNNSMNNSSGSLMSQQGMFGVQSTSVNAAGLSNTTLQSFETTPYKVIYYADINEISIIGGTQEQINLAGNFVKEFDKKQPQALVELSIIELSESGMKSFQTGWLMQNGKMAIDAGYNDMNSSGNKGWTGTTGTPFGQGYVFRDHTPGVDPAVYAKKLVTSIEMLITQKKGRVLSNPKIVVTNNQESKVDITSEYLSKRTETLVTSATAGNTKTVEYEKDSAGIQISIKPKITPDGYVTMDLSPTYTAPVGTETDGTNLVLTYVSKRTLDLKSLRVKDGETFIIGGLIQEQDAKTKSKIPVLSDIPVIGYLFGSSSNNKQRTELIIMVTPKIIKENDSI